MGSTSYPLVLVYGSNEAICHSFVSQRVRKYYKRIPSKEAFDEAWLHDTATLEQVDDDRGTRFGRSQAIRQFVLTILSRFSSKFRGFDWVFEPFRCNIRPVAAGPGAPGRREKSLLSSVIMRYLQENKGALRTAEQSKVVIDSSGRISGSKRTSRPVIPPFRELLSMFDGKPENLASTESL
jgi:hypothetical protein